MMQTLLLIFIVTVAAHLLALWLFPKWGLMDYPERYGHNRARLPYPTGLIAVAVFVVWLLTLLNPEGILQPVGLIIAVLVLAVVSAIDDHKHISAKIRLAVQFACSFIIFATGTRIYSLTSPLEGIAPGFELISLDAINVAVPWLGVLPVVSGIFTVLWLMLTTNALNWFDGIRGQVSSLSFIGFTTIGLLAFYRNDQPEFAMIAFVMAAIALGCALFDVPKQRVLLGDTGAMFFGLMIGVLTIYAGGKVATGFLVLGVPLIDLLLVTHGRITGGKHPFRGSQHGEHLHHRLLDKGWTREQVLTLTISLGLIFGITALFLSTLGKFILALVLFIVMVSLRKWSESKK